jgi:hypothetical protein
MVTPIEIGVVAVALLTLFVAYRVLKAAKGLAINAVVGVIVLLIANALGLGVEISLVAVLVCAFAGVPGAILVILLSLLDIAFVVTALPIF